MFIENHFLEIVYTCAAIVIILILRSISRYLIKNYAAKYELDRAHRKYANKFVNFISLIFSIICLSVIWNVSLRGLSIYFASAFTIIGVALFASWSSLSNITAAIIMFFNSPFKIGSKIEIMDKDDTVRGVVLDITLFFIQLKTDDGHIVNYPNNIAIQKPVKQIL